MTWTAVQGELQRDWAREAAIPAIMKIGAQHGGGAGVALAWETQLLNTPTPATGARAWRRRRPAQRAGPRRPSRIR